VKRWRWSLWAVLLVVAGWSLAGFYGFGDPETQFARILMADGGLKVLRQRDSAWSQAQLRWQQRRVAAGYERFLKQHPDHARAMTAYGCFLYDEHREPEAVQMWERAISTDPGLAVAYNNLGEHLSHCGQVPTALTYFDKARALAPDTAVFHYNWATVCALFRRDAQRVYGWDDAEVFRRSLIAFRRARELDPQNYQYASAYAGTFLLMRQPDWEEAHAAWRFCLGIPTEEAERQFTYGRLSRISMRLGRYDEAHQWLEQMTVDEVSSMRDVLRRKLTDLQAAAGDATESTARPPHPPQSPPQQAQRLAVR